MIVVDASAAVLGLLGDGEARAVLGRERLVCPHVIDAEVLHALRTHVRRGELSPEDAARAVDVWGRLGMERLGIEGLLGRVWELRENVSACDAAYVAVAEALEVPLLTADGRLARSPGPRCTISVVRH